MNRQETFKVDDTTGKVVITSQEIGCANYHQYSFVNMSDAVNFCLANDMHPLEF